VSIDAPGVRGAAQQARGPTTKAGRTFATAMLRAPLRVGTDTEAPPVCFLSAIGFDDAAVFALLVLGTGDASVLLVWCRIAARSPLCAAIPFQ
jgi:hypothetical protein